MDLDDLLAVVMFEGLVVSLAVLLLTLLGQGEGHGGAENGEAILQHHRMLLVQIE